MSSPARAPRSSSPRRADGARYTVVADATASPDPERFPFIAVLDGLSAWQNDPSAASEELVRRALTGAADYAGSAGAFLEVSAEPFRPLAFGVGTLTAHPGPESHAREYQLRADEPGLALGTLWLDGIGPQAPAVVRAFGRAIYGAWAVAEAEDTTRRLAALDAASRAVVGVLAVDRVLQTIVDNVRQLVGARYAALGTTDQEGFIDRFITSGISRTEREAIGAPPRGHGLLGVLIREGRPLRVDRIADHPASVGFPPNHPPMASLLGVPLVAKSRVVGDLYLSEKEGDRPFTDRDQEIVELFALHAAIAIDNARLHEQVSRLAVVEERERIGKDLHDGIIQAIYAVALSLEDVPELMEPEPDEAAARIDRAIEGLNLAIRDIRNFIFGLRPELLERAGLVAGLSALAEEFRLNTMIDVDLVFDGREADGLSDEATQQFLHIAREALSNVARHSKATQARLELSSDDGLCRLVISDNGRGFASGVPRSAGHQGLANMGDRAVGMGGRLEVDSAPGDGTRIIVTIPRTHDEPLSADDARPALGGDGRRPGEDRPS